MIKRLLLWLFPQCRSSFARWRQYGVRVILDVNPGVWVVKPKAAVGYRVDYQAEKLSRDYVLNYPGSELKFLDVGGGDGRLSYLLGQIGHTFFDDRLYSESREKFFGKYQYFAVDLQPRGETVIFGDICDENFLDAHRQYLDKFDVVYSNNVFEHLEKPWIAAANLLKLVKPGGICITLVPFSVRYHEAPGDFFRYTHTCIPHLFRLAGPIQVLEQGYDISARRNDEQGSGKDNDICPVDGFGAWRETWTTVSIIRKI